MIFRFILICIIIYLLVRSFVRFFAEQISSSDEVFEEKRRKSKKSGVPRRLGSMLITRRLSISAISWHLVKGGSDMRGVSWLFQGFGA